MTVKNLMYGLYNNEWQPLAANENDILKIVITNPSNPSGEISINQPLPVATESEEAEDNQRVFCKWVNNKVPGAAQVVLTDATLVLNLVADRIYKITQICMELTTSSDDVSFELGYTTGTNGTGIFTSLTPKRYLKTGATSNGFDGITFSLQPALPITYNAGVVESVTFRVDCNDAAATITPGFHGYYKGI